jgi:ribosome-associated translation inhibitor RaiA
MSVPVEITFRSIPPSPAVEAAITRWVAKLEHAYARIARCSVVVEIPHRRQRQGNAFRVAIQLAVPGETITVAREPGFDPAHEDLYVAIGDAFRAARRRLQDYARIRRGEVKLHA